MVIFSSIRRLFSEFICKLSEIISNALGQIVPFSSTRLQADMLARARAIYHWVLRSILGLNVSFMVPNRASDVPAAVRLSQTHVKNYRYFSRVVIRFFSVVEIPIKHPSLYNKKDSSFVSLRNLKN